MGCNCRKAKNIQDSLTNSSENQNNGIIGKIKQYFNRIIQGLLFVAVIAFLLPFIVLYLYALYVLNGSLNIKIPKFLSNKL